MHVPSIGFFSIAPSALGSMLDARCYMYVNKTIKSPAYGWIWKWIQKRCAQFNNIIYRSWAFVIVVVVVVITIVDGILFCRYSILTGIIQTAFELRSTLYTYCTIHLWTVLHFIFVMPIFCFFFSILAVFVFGFTFVLFHVLLVSRDLSIYKRIAQR